MKHNYLNNRDILKEIHKSKTTYCSFLTPEDANFDIILPGLDKINKKNTTEGKKLRAERLARAAYDLAQSQTTDKLKLDDFSIKPSKILETDIVFRIMTWDHVPVDTSSKKKKVVVDKRNNFDYKRGVLIRKRDNKNNIINKRCGVCFKWKDLNFGKDKYSRDGLSYRCIDCKKNGNVIGNGRGRKLGS